MAKFEVIPFGDFVRGEWQPKTYSQIILDHINRNKKSYTLAGATIVTLMVGNHVFAAGVDEKVAMIYSKLLNIGKWVIVFKGGLDIINNFVQGDMMSARKNFLGYLLVYVLLYSLPWALDQVDALFKEL